MTPLLASRPRTDRSFERLYRRHVADVYHYALAVLRNPADAEDVTQTTFLNAYRAYERGERPHAPHNWLIAIAHNVCRQRFRQSARRPQEVEFEADVADVVADDDAPTADDIRKALSHLAFNQRAALVMRELEGRSYAEIGEILGLSVSAVETLIFRARRALREQLEGSLTCREAELAISRQADGRLTRAERGPLRAHLRECGECATFARSQRAQRAAFKALAAVPVPSSLATFFGGGAATAVGTGIFAKAAGVVAAALVAGGVGYEAVERIPADEPRLPVAADLRRDGARGAGTERAGRAGAIVSLGASSFVEAADAAKAAKARGSRGAGSAQAARGTRPAGKGKLVKAASSHGKARAKGTDGRGKSDAAHAARDAKKPKAAGAATRGNGRLARAGGQRSSGRGWSASSGSRATTPPQRAARPARPSAPPPPRRAPRPVHKPKAKAPKPPKVAATAVPVLPPAPTVAPTEPKLPKS